METPQFEELPNNERNAVEQALHLQEMAILIRETGFMQTFEMETLRTNLSVWQEEVQKVTEELHKKNPIEGMRLQIGVLLSLASIYYEQRNADSYFENLDAAADLAEYAGFSELLEKIKTLG